MKTLMDKRIMLISMLLSFTLLSSIATILTSIVTWAWFSFSAVLILLIISSAIIILVVSYLFLILAKAIECTDDNMSKFCNIISKNISKTLILCSILSLSNCAFAISLFVNNLKSM